MRSRNNSGIWVGLAITVIVIFFIYSNAKTPNVPNPRIKNGIDTLYTQDSAYRINFTIDTAFPIGAEYEEKNY